jgi:hypothetical protein
VSGAGLADQIVVWVGALLTLMIFSFLYRDNPFYKFAEHLFVGVSAAYWMVTAIWSTLVPNLFGRLYPPMIQPFLPAVSEGEPNVWYALPLALGLLVLARLVDRIAWLSRWAMAFVIGFAAGTNLTRYLQSDFVGQIKSTIVPLVVLGDAASGGGLDVGVTVRNLVVVGGTLTGLVYFFFSKEHTGATGRAARVGIWVLMVTFGAAFGYTVMARISLLIGRFNFLGQWLGGMF